MKNLLTLAIVLFLTACGQAPLTETEPQKAPTTPKVINTLNAGTQPLEASEVARLGDACGPSTKKLCASGLSCQFEGTQQAVGKCLTVVVNPDLECDNTQAPVCGLIASNKNGYLNKCFAKKYGAVVLNAGFCKNDETIANNCSAPAYGIGNCQDSFSGARFNTTTNRCETVTMVGCNADIPFKTLEACQNTCQ